MQTGCAGHPRHSEEISASPGACGATKFPMEAALLTPNRQQGWSHSWWRPCSVTSRAVLFGAGSLGPGSCRFVSYIKKPLRLNTLGELISAREQSLLLSLSYQHGLPTGEVTTIPRAGTGDVDSSTSFNCFLWHLFVRTTGNENFSQAQTLFCNSTQVECLFSL